MESLRIERLKGTFNRSRFTFHGLLWRGRNATLINGVFRLFGFFAQVTDKRVQSIRRFVAREHDRLTVSKVQRKSVFIGIVGVSDVLDVIHVDVPFEYSSEALSIGAATDFQKICHISLPDYFLSGEGRRHLY